MDADRTLTIGNAFMLSYHGVTNTYDLDLRVNLKTDSASIDVRSRANTEAQEEVTQQRNFGNYHATFNWDWAPKTITNRFFPRKTFPALTGDDSFYHNKTNIGQKWRLYKTNYKQDE